ncbi:MAG: NUMOD4 domain-containing protein [Bacteroidia bacterium]
MIKKNPNEKWKEIRFNVKGMKSHYAISSHGRVASYKKKLEDGNLLSGTLNNGYLSLKIKPAGRDIQMMVHRLAAEAFMKKSGSKKKFVIHLNFKKTDNALKNLRWATKEEMEKHQQKSPNVIRSRNARRLEGHKLNIGKVKQIKKMFKNPGKSTMKSIARKFRISEMQLYRIKRGENWGHVKG